MAYALLAAEPFKPTRGSVSAPRDSVPFHYSCFKHHFFLLGYCVSGENLTEDTKRNFLGLRILLFKLVRAQTELATMDRILFVAFALLAIFTLTRAQDAEVLKVGLIQLAAGSIAGACFDQAVTACLCCFCASMSSVEAQRSLPDRKGEPVEHKGHLLKPLALSRVPSTTAGVAEYS